MPYLGNTPEQQAFTPAVDYFSGNGSTTAFTLSRPVASVAQIQAVIENVPQNPGDAYTVSGNTITFTSAPPSGTNNIYVYYTSPITTVATLTQDPVIIGSMTYSSSGARIRGDFSNATVANRVMFQTSTTNGNTIVGAVPNGTSSTAVFRAFNSSSDTVNVGQITFGITSTNAFLAAGALGSGTQVPLGFEVNGSERLRIDTSGNVGIGTSSPTAGFRLDVVGGDFRVSDVSSDDGVEIGWSAGGDRGFVQAYDRNASAFRNLTLNNAATVTSDGLLQFNSGYGSVATAYGCRAWVRFNGTGTVAINGSGNVSSITDGGVGTFTINFTTALPDANYSAVGNAVNSTNFLVGMTSGNNPTTTSLPVRVTDPAGNLTDPTFCFYTIFR